MTSRDTYDIRSYEQEELYLKLIEIAKWHAQLQINFEKELNSESLNL